MSETATVDPTSPPPAADPAPPPAASAPPDWKATLPPDLVEKVTAKGWADPAAAIKSYVELEQFAGRKGAVMPKEGDPPEVMAAWRTALGVPEKPEGYDLKAPEGMPPAAWDNGRAANFAAVAWELGLTPAQVKGVIAFEAKNQSEAMQRAAEGIEPDGRKMEDVLRGEWGANYDAKIEHAKRAARQFGAEAGALDALEAKIGGAALTRLFARIGEAIGEDSPAGMGTGSPASRDPKAEIADLMKQDGPYWKPLHPDHKATVQRVTDLHRQLAAREAA